MIKDNSKKNHKKGKSVPKSEMLASDFASALIDNTSDAITVINLKGEILFWNNGAAELSGYSEEEVLGKHISIVYRKQDMPDLYERIKKAMQGEFFTNKELILIDKDKKEHTVLLTLNGLKDESGQVTQLVGFTKDISELKIAQQTLIESEQRFVQAFDNSPVPMSILNLKTGKRLEVNNSFCKIFGYSEKELIAEENIHKVNIAVRQEEFKLAVNKCLTDGALFEFPFSLYTRSGEIRDVLLNATLAYDNNEDIFITSYLDVTDRKRAENALKTSEENYRSLFEQSLVGIGMSKGNEVIFANKALLKIFMYDSLEEFKKAPLLDHITAASRPLIKERMKEVLGNNEQNLPSEFQYEILCRNGEIKTLQAHSSHVEINGQKYSQITVIDITEQNKSEIELINIKEKAVLSERFLDNIINNIGDPFFVKDDESRILLVNDAFCKLFDLTRENIIGKTLAEDVSPEERKSFLRIDKQVLKTGNESIIEESLTVRGGQTKTISTRKTRYVDSAGKRYLIGVIRDITDRKIAEQKLKESEASISAILNSLPASVCVIDDTGKILQVNDSWKEFGDLNGMPKGTNYNNDYNYFDVCRQDFPEKDAKSVLEGLLGLLENKTKEFEYEYPCHSPDKRQWFSMRADLMKSREKQIVISHIDITARKHAEENRNETLSRLNLAVNTAKLGVWSLDIETGELLWNENMFEIYGTAPSEFDNTMDSFRKMLHPEDLEYVNEHMGDLSRDRSVSDVHFRIIRPNGEVRDIDASALPVFDEGKLDKIIGINRDITEEKHAQEKLTEALSRLNLAVNTAKLGVWSLDLNADELFWSDRLFEIFGITSSEFDGTMDSFLKRVHQDDLDRVNQQMKEIFNNKSVFDVNFRIMRPNNEVRYIDSSASPVFINGHLEKIIGINRDITERKTSEKELENALHQLTELKQQIEAENIYLKEELKLEGSYDEIVGASKSLSKVLKQVEQVAKTDSTVLVLGETGTGKELIALAVHDASDRKNKPLVKVNCSALPSDLIESELFGHEKGAFTGAINRKIGRFELANGGTIFLDEIGDLPIDLQTRLLRVLQESEFERLGGETTIKVDVRVIAATNRNLEKRVLENKFRQDLYYRLNVFPIKCPPLRDRLGDIPSLVNHFVNKYNHKVNHKIKTVNQKTIERLIQYNWPGNIRELEHVIERAVIINQGKQLRLGNWFADSSTQNVVSDELSTLEVMERNHIKKVLEKTNWKIRGRQGAAEILGLKPTTLESRMKKLMIIRST